VAPLLALFARVLADVSSLTTQVRTLRSQIETFATEARAMAGNVEEQDAAITVLEEDVGALVAERDTALARLTAAEALIGQLRGDDDERLAIQAETYPTAWERVLGEAL
jgi:outer membrane murein-binding lipoprotein Lpp